MTQAINQFSQTAEKGLVDIKNSPNTISCQVDASESGTLVPGQCVKLYTTAGGVPKVVKIAADTDEIFGVIPYDVKGNSYVAGDYLEIAFDYDVIYMEASAAVARGAKVMAVVTGSKAATATVGKTILGIALDAAAGSASLFRVLIKVASANQSTNQAAFVAQVSTANATDLATAEALANQLKTSVNAILTSLINAGLMAAS